MVSAVHRISSSGSICRPKLQRGCTWLVQFIVSAVHPGVWHQHDRHLASKGLHMVSAVHQTNRTDCRAPDLASKGLHMVSAVHPDEWWDSSPVAVLQRGCTWLVQFIICSWRVISSAASLQRGCTWLVQFISWRNASRSAHVFASKGLHMVSAVHL